jgi:hypothetical protein
MRTIPPERGEFPKIRRAFRAATFMKWASVPLLGVAAILAVVIGASSGWRVGLAFYLLAWAVLFVAGYSRARCPRCAQVWWSWMGMLTLAPWWLVAAGAGQDETDSFVCRRCGLDIGMGLKE